MGLAAGMTFRFDVLGSSGSGPTRTAPTSGYLLRTDTTTLGVEMGMGVFHPLADMVDPMVLDGVILSHIHPDHCLDIFSLFAHLAYPELRRTGLPVYVPPGAADHLASFVKAEPGSRFLKVLDFIEMDDGDTARIGDVSLTFAETIHPVPTLAVRFEVAHDQRDATLVYSADTGPGGGFPDLARGADLVVCEATVEGPRTAATFGGHLTAVEAAEIAARAGAGRLSLTHLAPTVAPESVRAAAAAVFPRSVDLAVPGASYII